MQPEITGYLAVCAGGGESACAMATMQQDRAVHRCQFCSFSSATKRDIIKHLKDSHVNENGFFMKCLLCDRTFCVFSSFTSHVSRSHPRIAMENAYESEMNRSTPSTSQVESEEQDDTSLFLDSSVDHDHVTDVSFSAGNFIVGLKEKIN